MKCPFKKQVTLKDKHGWEVNKREDASKVITDFGECDLRGCMAYNISKGKCMMMGRREEC